MGYNQRLSGVGKTQKLIQDLQNYDIPDHQFVDPKGDR